jgi:hypothetical protein
MRRAHTLVLEFSLVLAKQNSMEPGRFAQVPSLFSHPLSFSNFENFFEAINHCTLGDDTCAPVGSTCTFTGPGTYSCSCNQGFNGTGYACSAINNCTNGKNNCAVGTSICTYTGPGAFNCSCTSNYHGNGTTCDRREFAFALEPHGVAHPISIVFFFSSK